MAIEGPAPPKEAEPPAGAPPAIAAPRRPLGYWAPPPVAEAANQAPPLRPYWQEVALIAILMLSPFVFVFIVTAAVVLLFTWR